ncbi:hypothetical protein MYX82_10150 [Acidobacteria bacterium AH-259-D05]|nr:hypothetical protein [Acidobacteria bacterium AH-259-D05]
MSINQAEGVLDLSLPVPANLPAGFYRPLLWFRFEGVPVEPPPTGPLVDRGNPRERTGSSGETGLFFLNGTYLPVVQVGSPDVPRLYWTLLMDTLSNGTRGVRALEDRDRFGVASRILTQSETFIVPRLDSASGPPLTYRLEPFAPTVSIGDRSLPSRPLIPFRFPSGSLTVRVRKPDGSVDILGPAPFVQARMRSLVDRNGRLLDDGGGHISDAYQLSTMDPSFEVQFTQDGRHVIALEGSIEDIWGNTWKGGGTYEVYVARTLSLDTTVLPGTPFEVGDVFNPGLVLTPPVPADVEVRFQLAPDSDASQMVEQKVQGRANRFGYFATGDGQISLDQQGEYRVDVRASFRDEQGNLWMGTRTWGGAVTSDSPSIIAHGRRGIDDQPTIGPQWFFRTDTGVPIASSHVPFPFNSGDISWLQKSDASIPLVTFQDPSGSMVDLLRARAQGSGLVAPPGTFDERAVVGEVPLFSSRPDGLDPHLDPSKVDLWGYSYRSVQRPLVRVREEIGEDGMPTAYWRFNEQYARQFGVGANSDLPNDIKFQYGAAVLRGPALDAPQYAIHGSLFVLVPDDDPGGGTRTFPPFQGNGGGPSGGPIMTLKGTEIDIFIHLTGTRPGSILQVGDVVSWAGHIGPTLPSKMQITVTSPEGTIREITGQANRVGYFYDPSTDFIVEEPGPYRVKVKVWHDGLTSAGPVQEPFPTGDVLGSNEGEFFFYVVEPGSGELQVNIARNSFVRPAEGPINISLSSATGPLTVSRPSQLKNAELRFTTVMPGFILEEGRMTELTYSYDAPRLHEDFPNLDLFDSDGRAGADTITMSFLVSGINEKGEKVYQARQVLLQGEELMALRHQSPIDGFAQFGNGAGISSTLILVNPSSLQTAVGTTQLFDSEGKALQVVLNGEAQKGSFSFQVPAAGMGFFETDGLGDTVTGSGQLSSTIPIGGTVLFAGDTGVAGVGMVRPVRDFLVPIESDSSRGIQTGVAFSNPTDSEVNVAVTVRQADGTPVPNGSVTVSLSPHGQLAQFPEHIFQGTGIDFSGFRGNLQVSSPEPIIGMAIRVSPGQLATLPVTSPTAESTTLHFAQFGDGGGISSTLILVNPFDETANGTVNLFDSGGNALSVDINGTLQSGSFSFTLPPRGVGFYATDGEGGSVSGSVKVESSLPVGGTILFAGDLGVAGVGSVEPAARFLVPIESDASRQVQTGVALANPISSSVEITLTLRDADGMPIPEASASVSLPAHGQLAEFPEQIFAGKGIDFSKFRGTLEVSASVPVAGMAIRVSPGEFATLPVTRMN